VKPKKVPPPVRNNIQTRKSSRKMETIAEEDTLPDHDVQMAETSNLAGTESKLAGNGNMAGIETKMTELSAPSHKSDKPVIIEPVEDILDIEEDSSLPTLLPSTSLHRTPADEFLKDELDKSLEEV